MIMAMQAAQFSAAEELIVRYWRALDRSDYPAVLDCLAEDVDWRVSEPCRGRAEVAAVLQRRPLARVTRHVVTNMLIEPRSGGCAASYVLMAFAHQSEGEDRPHPISCPSILADMDVEMESVGADWRMTKMAADVIFR